MKADECDLVVLGTAVRETIGAMTEARKIGWTVDYLGAAPTNVIEVPMLGKDVVEGLYAAALFEIPYEDTAKGDVKEWLINYKKMFGISANTQAIIGYNAIETFAFYAGMVGRDLTGQNFLTALESGKEFHDIFGSPPVKFFFDQSPCQRVDDGAADSGRTVENHSNRADVLMVRCSCTTVRGTSLSLSLG